MKEFRYFSSDYILIFLIMLSTGLTSLLYEVVLLSIVVTIVGATEISAAIVLSSFLLGLAIGGLIGGKIVEKQASFVKILVAMEIVIAIFGFFFLGAISNIAAIGISSNTIFWIIIVMMLVPTIIMGMEIPIAVKILELNGRKNVTGFVYFSDTLGGVLGALFSGLIFVPWLGFHGTMYLGATLNIFASVLATRIGKRRNFILLILSVAILIFTSIIIFNSKFAFNKMQLDFLDSFYSVGSIFSETYYTEPVYSVSSPFQHILILRSPYYGYQLVLDGELQVSERDSIKYHEYLVLPAIVTHPNPKNVLVIGGGDGGSLYQLLKFNLTRIDHVELDEKVIEVSREYLKDVNKGSLDNKRVNRIIMDGRKFLKETKNETYDIIIIDLPNPRKLEVTPLYTKEFYNEVKRVLAKDGFVATQAGSPYFFLEGYTSIYRTMKEVMPKTYPYVFPGSAAGSLGYVISGKSMDPRITRSNISETWYSHSDNQFIFKFPKFLENYYSNSSIQISTDKNPIVHVYMQNNYYFRDIADK